MKRRCKTSVGRKSVVFGDVLDVIDDRSEERNPDTGPDESDSIYTIRVSLDQVVVALRHPSVLYFRGVVEAKAIAGSFETMGYQVNDDDGRTYTLFSLEDSSANYISTVRYTVMTGRYLNVLFQLGLNEDVIYKIVNHVGCMGTVVLLSNAVERFQRWNEFLTSLDIQVFPAKLRKRGFPLFPEAEEALGAVFDDAGGTRIPKKLNICKDWDVIMSAFPTDQHFKVLFCGGKGVGKSTTMRYMINRRLQVSPKVLVIDLDVGQSEFTICGSVSAVVVYTPLLGPNYTHLKNPSRSYFVGNIDIAMSISSYLNAVRKLLNYCLYNPQFSNCTWFINTMGITKGIGLGLLATIIKLVLPDFVLQIQSNDNQLNFDAQLQPQNILGYGAPRLFDIKKYTLFTVRSAVISSYKDRRFSNIIGLTPKTLREIVMLVYLRRAAVDNNKRSRFFKYRMCNK
ncbi:polynucleotide 5'-hydroxyl-kinase nol9 isoform X2 [Cimex lectularius]|uniref:Polynucleotide 5'-hydroxyl-kinase NOL9 n=1 Tax=Cimex lectularius TaxID=79782 RepID=A0A8I6REB8_CIMLE|nr:polynucleotide 5'-hydroxyl-kinase nol9 isoform X2 [Cimex lectularius]